MYLLYDYLLLLARVHVQLQIHKVKDVAFIFSHYLYCLLEHSICN